MKINDAFSSFLCYFEVLSNARHNSSNQIKYIYDFKKYCAGRIGYRLRNPRLFLFSFPELFFILSLSVRLSGCDDLSPSKEGL